MVMKFKLVLGEYFKKLDITSNINQDIKTNQKEWHLCLDINRVFGGTV